MVVITMVTLARCNNPPGLEVEVDPPPACRVGQDVTLTVRVRNTLPTARKLTSVDFAASYLAGLVVKQVDPKPVEQATKPTLGQFVHRMDVPLAAGAEQTVNFVLHGAKAGDFGGDVTVYVDGGNFRYIAKPVRTVVTAS